MKSITFYINEELGLNESRLKEQPSKKVVKILIDNGFEKGKDFNVKNGSVYLNSEDIAMSVSDELVGDYEVTYDDQDDFKLTLFA